MPRIPLLPHAVALLAILIQPVQALAQTSGSAHSTPVPEVAVGERTTPIAIDGVLDEPGWLTAQPATDFLQVEPTEGQPATQRTEVRFLIDEDAIYVGARMFDDQGAAGVTTRSATSSSTATAALFEAKPTNIFLVKVNYWLNR